MTEEDREDLKKAIRKVLADEPAMMSIADRVLNEFDAKLSPKYPPKGAIVAATLRHTTAECVYTSFGDEGVSTAIDPDHAEEEWSEYTGWRVIPTAADALTAVRGWEIVPSAGLSPLEASRETATFFLERIQRLIDEAEHS